MKESARQRFVNVARAFQNTGGALSYQRDERTGSFAVTRSDSESIFQKQFEETMEITVVIQYILTATQFFGSQDYCKKSRMMIFVLADVLFYQNEQA